MSAKIGRNTPLRRLRPGVFRMISNMLDPDRKWAELAEHIYGRNGQPKFGYQKIRSLELAYQRPNGSPTRDMLDAWSTDNPTLDQLIEALREADLFVVSDYLQSDILGEPPDYHGAGMFTEDFTPAGHRGSPTQPSDSYLGAIPHRIPYTTTTANDNNMTGNTNNSDKTINVNYDHNLDKSMERKTRNKLQSSDDNAFESITEIKKNLKVETVCENAQMVQSGAPSHVEDLKCGSDQAENQDQHIKMLERVSSWIPGCPILQFECEFLLSITNAFNKDSLAQGGNFIGKGGFGEVFYGHIGKIEVAVKKLSKERKHDHTIQQFHTEVKILSEFRHEHLLPLVGYSEGTDFSLVYLYMPNGSLEGRLGCEGGSLPLTAHRRISIAKGSARGIAYLHTAKDREIVHRDIKSANILLDCDFVAKIGDCGLGHLGPSDPSMTHTETETVIGTSAYIAPEYRYGEVSVKVDAYAFGVVLLEILTGEHAFDSDRVEKDLCSHVTENCTDIMEMIDSRGGDWLQSTATSVYNLAQRLLENKTRRPKITEVMPEIEAWPES